MVYFQLFFFVELPALHSMPVFSPSPRSVRDAFPTPGQRLCRSFALSLYSFLSALHESPFPVRVLLSSSVDAALWVGVSQVTTLLLLLTVRIFVWIFTFEIS